MTPQILRLTVFILLLATSTSFALAWQELSEPKLSEPTSDSDVSRPEVDRPTSSRLRKKTSPAAANGALRKDPETKSPNVSGAPTSRSHPGEQISESENVLRLIAEDPAASSFFSSGIPRSQAVGADATINDLCHVGSLCWAVGERGVVCFSSDSGESWVTRFTPMDCSLKSVCFLTNRIGWMAGLRILPGTSQQSAVLLETRDGGNTWKDLAASASEVTGSADLATSSLPGILRIQFFGLKDAVAVTLPVERRNGAALFRTEDGGRSWSMISADQAGSTWTTGAFLSPSEGIVVGRQQSYAAIVSDQAVVISNPQPTLRQLRGVSLTPDGSGWIVGDGAMILKTANSGVTWEPASGDIPKSISELTDLHTVSHSGSTVLMAGNPASVLLRSVDDGQHFENVVLSAQGHIHRLLFLSDSEVIAAGSFGQILRSSDAGATWSCVRAADFRAGILNLVTDADKAAWQMLARNSAEGGLRAVTLQFSEPLNLQETTTTAARSVTSERSQLACSQLGGNESIADWMFPRTKPEHHRSPEQLMAEWTRRTDGQLARLLPLRVARDLRNWKPSVVVIEPISDDDAVAAIARDVILRAIRIAAGDDSDEESASESSDELSIVGLKPWHVERVFSRASSKQQTGLFFDNAELLPATGTTTGLLCDAILSLFPDDTDATLGLRSRASYELLMDRNDAVGLSSLIDGLEPGSLKDARRPMTARSREEIASLEKTLRTAHVEGVALQGHSRLAGDADSLTAELETVGVSLPDLLAVKQLRDLATVNLQQNNMEAFLSIQQEVIRRYPNSEDGRKAAEMLFLFYSSAEARYYRIRNSSQSPFGMSATMAVPSLDPEQSNPAIPNANIVQPKFEAPTALPFSATATDPSAALQEKWDQHVATAFRILSSSATSDGVHRAMNPTVVLRHAVNQRNQNRTGEQNNALAELAERDDEFGVFARSEIQLSSTALPGVPVYNLQRRSEPPFLDGRLSDSLWENAEEMTLRTFRAKPLSNGSNAENSKRSSEDSETSSLAMVAWDEEFLYFAGRFQHDPQHRGPIQLATDRNYDAKHGSRDRFEIEIDTDRDFVTSFQLTVDESGRTSDRCWLLDRWNPKWYVAVDSDDSTWRVEAAIPFSEIAARPAKPGDLWSIKLRRVLPGVLQHELVAPATSVSTNGTALVRFIRPKVVSGGRAK